MTKIQNIFLSIKILHSYSVEQSASAIGSRYHCHTLTNKLFQLAYQDVPVMLHLNMHQLVDPYMPSIFHQAMPVNQNVLIILQ